MAINQKIEKILDPLIDITFKASALVSKAYHQKIDAALKDDGTLITETDRQSENLIVQAIKKLTPEIPIIAEESVASGDVPDISQKTFWCIDPLDGTDGFVKQTGDFAINIGLIHEGKPVLGLIASPLKQIIWLGYGNEIWRILPSEKIKLSKPTLESKQKIALTSPRLNDELISFLKEENITQHIKMGSALKFCEIVEGKAHIYPRFNRSFEWDTAAGHALLNAWGGNICLLSGEELSYGKKGFQNPFFVAKLNF